MTRYVLDASAGVDLLLNTEVGQQLQIEPDAEWWVPEHYFVEVSSAIRRAEMLTAITAEQTAVALRSLREAPLRIVSIRPLLDDAWTRRKNLTVADALYVVLAVHIGAALVTTDLRLTRSPALGVPVVTP